MNVDKDTLPRPEAKRLRRPSWKDGRLVTGVLLMLLAMAGSAATLRHFDHSVEVLRATHNLVPGDELGSDDVSTVKVRLDDGTGAYLAGAPPAGTRVTREVRAGELLPRSAVAASGAAETRTVAVKVEPAQVTTLIKGSVVDVWVALHTPGSVATTDYLEPRRQAEHVLVSHTPSTGTGFNATRDDYVSVLVPQDKVADLISAMNRGAKVTLVPTADSPTRAGAA